MKDGFVADASLGVAWVADGQAGEAAERLRTAVIDGAAIVVPVLWPLEVSNGLLMLYQRRRISRDTWMSALRKTSQIALTFDEDALHLAFTEISDLGAKYSLTIYDATYLELAIRRGLPLASRDIALNKAARKCGVKTLM